MNRLARILPALAVLVCGALAGRVLWSPMYDDYIWAPSVLPEVLVANGAGIAAAAVVAVLVTVTLARRRSITLVTGAAVVGLALLALPELLPYPDDPAVALYSNAVAGGLVLGTAALLAARERSAQAALAVGVVGAFMLSGSVVELRRSGTADFGWTAYTPPHPMEGASYPGVVGVWPVITAAVLVVLAAAVDRGTSWTARIDSRWLAAAAALPVAAFAAHQILIESQAPAGWWYPYVAVATALVAWIAWQLPGRDGQIVFAGGALVAATAGALPATSVDWWSLVIPAALVVAGVVAGDRWPVPAVGFGLLAVVAAASLVGRGQWDGGWEAAAIAHAFLLPVAAGYVVGSCLPTSAPATTVGLSLPFTVGIPGVAAAAWTVGERFADYSSASSAAHSVAYSPPAAAVAIAVVVVCGVGAWGLDLRSGSR